MKGCVHSVVTVYIDLQESIVRPHTTKLLGLAPYKLTLDFFSFLTPCDILFECFVDRNNWLGEDETSFSAWSFRVKVTLKIDVSGPRSINPGLTCTT